MAVSSAPPGRTRLTASFCVLAACTLGFVYGCSALVLPVSAALAGGTLEGAEGKLAGGYFLYGTSLLLILFNAFAFLVAFWLPSRPLSAARSCRVSLVMWVWGCACLSLSVQWRLPVLLFVGFAILAFPLATIDLYLCHIELPLAWREGGVHKGMACLGLSIGLGAIFWTLLTGEVAHAYGAAAALWAVTGVQALALLGVQVLCAPDRLFYDRAAAAASSCGSGRGGTSAGSEGGEATQQVEEAKEREHETAPVREVLWDWRAWAFCYVICAMTFCGRSIKMLISVIFEQALSLDYLDSVRLSALYLSLYCLGRGLTPLFVVRDRVFALYAGVLAVETVAYGVTPWSLSLDTYKRPVYIVLRLLSGGGFAVLLGNIAVLSVRIFGVAKNHQIMGLLMTVEWMSGAGPSFAWALHVLEIQSGRPATESYNAFFLICSGVAASAVVAVLALRRAQSTRDAAEKAAGLSAQGDEAETN